jgi:tripartite-type tricarboxylate transporter receptor subunit TctC
MRNVTLLALVLCVPAWAQTWPSKPVRIIMETAAGSVFDTATRAVAQQVGQQLGQSFLVENRPGANGVVAMEACARATPDGYTGCTVATNGFSFNPHTFAKLPYDPDKDFRPVAFLVSPIDSLVVSTALPVKSLQELRALAAAKPGALNFGTLGEGSSPDVFRQALGDQWKTRFTGIPYKGGANVTAAALMSGEIDMSKGSLGSWIGGINGGKIRLLAVSTAKRMPQFPDVPTFPEVALTSVGGVFFGLALPAGVPDAVVTRLNGEVNRALADPKVLAAIASRYLEARTMTVAEFTDFLRRDREETGVLIRKYNVPKQ